MGSGDGCGVGRHVRGLGVGSGVGGAKAVVCAEAPVAGVGTGVGLTHKGTEGMSNLISKIGKSAIYRFISRFLPLRKVYAIWTTHAPTCTT